MGRNGIQRAAGALCWVALAAAFLFSVNELRPRARQFYDAFRFETGWDLQVTCSGFRSLLAGDNPYVWRIDFTLPYSPLHVFAVSPLCVTREPVLFGIVFAIVTGISALLLLKATPGRWIDRAIIFVMFAVGLDALRWQFKTGNIAIFEWPLATATALLILNGRYRTAGVAFGALGTIKLLPIVGAAAFLLLPLPLRVRIAAFASAIGSFAVILGLNAVFFLDLTKSWLALITHRLPGGLSYEKGDRHNPNLIDLITDVLQSANVSHPTGEFVFLAFGVGLGWLATLVCLQPENRNPKSSAAVFSIAVVVMWLILFRQKPYAFGTFIPFLMVAAYAAGLRTVIAVALASTLVPALLLRFFELPSLLREYYQMFALTSAVLVLLLGSLITSSRPGEALRLRARLVKSHEECNCT